MFSPLTPTVHGEHDHRQFVLEYDVFYNISVLQPTPEPVEDEKMEGEGEEEEGEQETQAAALTLQSVEEKEGVYTMHSTSYHAATQH